MSSHRTDPRPPDPHRPENWGILSTTAVNPIPFAKQWVAAHAEDAHRILGKPLLVEEFGRSLQADATGAGRGEFYEAVMRGVEAARAQGAAAAALAVSRSCCCSGRRGGGALLTTRQRALR